MDQKTWYAFKNSTDTDVELYLYGEIGFYGIGAKQFISELRAVKGKNIHLRINSPGGEVVEGTNIYNALRRHEGGVTVHIDALAASMASVIAMSGNPIYMAENALMMIHDPYMMAGGNSQELRKNADLLDIMKNNLVRAYTKKTGLPENEISAMMKEETWMDSTTAAALGFIDAIEDGVQAAASMTPQKAKAIFDKLKVSMSEILTEPAAETEELENEPVAVLDEIMASLNEVETKCAEMDDEGKAALADRLQSMAAAIMEPEEEPTEEEAKAAADMVAAVKALKDKLSVSESQVALIKAELEIANTDKERLAAAAGVVSANVVPNIGSQTEPGRTLLDQFNEISDPTERTRFFKQHSIELRKLSAGATSK